MQSVSGKPEWCRRKLAEDECWHCDDGENGGETDAEESTWLAIMKHVSIARLPIAKNEIEKKNKRPVLNCWNDDDGQP